MAQSTQSSSCCFPNLTQNSEPRTQNPETPNPETQRPRQHPRTSKGRHSSLRRVNFTASICKGVGARGRGCVVLRCHLVVCPWGARVPRVGPGAACMPRHVLARVVHRPSGVHALCMHAHAHLHPGLRDCEELRGSNGGSARSGPRAPPPRAVRMLPARGPPTALSLCRSHSTSFMTWLVLLPYSTSSRLASSTWRGARHEAGRQRGGLRAVAARAGQQAAKTHRAARTARSAPAPATARMHRHARRARLCAPAHKPTSPTSCGARFSSTRRPRRVLAVTSVVSLAGES